MRGKILSRKGGSVTLQPHKMGAAHRGAPAIFGLKKQEKVKI